MNYEGNIIRPPSEANSIILQVTTGCSHNKCTFCGAYKDKSFRIKTDTIDQDIDFAAKHCIRQKRVFLADGDALVIPQRRLLEILEKIKIKIPWVNRISTYANGKSIRLKSVAELIKLRQLGLDRIYLGLESGDDRVLAKIIKGETAQSMIDAAQKVRESGLFLSVTVLLGIAGKQHSSEHAIATGKILSAMQANQIAALTVMPIPGTVLHDDMSNGSFVLPDSHEILAELKILIENIQSDRVQFFANHASNYLHLSGRLQKDKEKLLNQIDEALLGNIPLVQDSWRAL